jgi:hypothetical protein
VIRTKGIRSLRERGRKREREREQA